MKKLLTYAFIFLSALFAGCSNASSSVDAEDSQPSSSSNENLDLVPPGSVGAVPSNPILTRSDFTSRNSGDEVFFTGTFGFIDTADFRLQFTSLEFSVKKENGDTTPVNVTISTPPTSFPTKGNVDLSSNNSAFTSIDLLDKGFTECGRYILIATVYAGEAFSDEPKKHSRTEVIPFEREAAYYCHEQNQDPGQQQPVKPEIPMSFCEVVVSTNANPGLDFASCTAIPAPATTADIIFSKVGTRDNSEVTATSGNGTQFAPISNGDLLPSNDDYEVDIWPEDMNVDRNPATAYVSDFKFKSINQTTIEEMIENRNQIYVAKTTAYNEATGAGFYAFAIADENEGNNGNRTMTIKIYKVQK